MEIAEDRASQVASNVPAPMNLNGSISIIEIPLNDKHISEVCAICQETLSKGEKNSSYIDCMDWFHFDCIKLWLDRGRDSCPTCREKCTLLTKFT